MCYIEKGRIPHPSAINPEHVQGCVGPSFSVYTIPVLKHLCRKCTVLPSPYLQLCHCFLVGVGLGVGREGSILGGGWWVKAEGEAVAMRAVNSVSVGLRLCLVLFLS